MDEHNTPDKKDEEIRKLRLINRLLGAAITDSFFDFMFCILTWLQLGVAMVACGAWLNNTSIAPYCTFLFFMLYVIEKAGNLLYDVLINYFGDDDNDDNEKE